MNVLESSTSISFKNILFLTDFSQASSTALAYAMAFARHYDACLYPAYVQMPNAGTYVTEPFTIDYSKEMLEGNRGRVAEVIRAAGSSNLSFQAIAEEGLIENVVPQLIEEHGIDLVVIGTHGRKGVERFLMGSTAEMIFRTATCPVLTVGPHVSQKPSWEPKIKSILFATDLSPDSEYGVPYALSFAHESHCQITFLHVIPEEYRHHADHRRLVQFMQAELKRLVPVDGDRWYEAQIRVEEGEPAEKILEVAEAEQADLIVLGLPKEKEFSTHFRTGVTYSVVSKALCPVLTVRDSRGK